MKPASLLAFCIAAPLLLIGVNSEAVEDHVAVKLPEPATDIDYAAMAASTGQTRKLLQASADATAFNDEVTTGPAGYCNLYTSKNVPDECPSQAPFPACCNSKDCYANSDGESGYCNSNTAPQAACCPAFNQKSNVCQPPDSKAICSYSKRPVPACCNSDTCKVNKNGDGGSCSSYGAGVVAKCCPA